MESKTAFVTGGTGFLGINLISRLVEEGWQVTALHRPQSNLTYLGRFPFTLAEGSLTDPASLAQALPAGTRVVFHVAGDTNTWSKHNARQTATNVDGTRHLVEAAVKKGVETFIHTSSTSAWGQISGHITEETPQAGKNSWINYQRSKWAGAQEALKGMAKGMKVVIMCPASIIGPYDRTTWGRLFFAIRDGALPMTPPGSASFTHVREVVRAHINGVTRGRPGESYILAGEPSSQAALVGEVARLMGRKPPPVAPAAVFHILGHLAGWQAAVTGRPPLISPELAAMTTKKGVTFSSQKAVRELDYKIVPLADGLRDCYDWLVAEGLLEAP